MAATKKSKTPKKAKVISLSQFKGGTSKTSSAINIGACLVKRGYKVLAVDTDQQANFTSWLGVDPVNLKLTMRELLTEEQVSIQDVRVNTAENIDLVPAHVNLALVEFKMPAIQRELVLARKLEPVLGEYDFIIIDTAPYFGVTSVNAFSAADYMLVPVQPEPLCLQGLAQLAEVYDLVRRSTNPNLKLLGAFISLYEAKLGVHKEMANQVRTSWENLTFDTVIRKRSNILEATLNCRSVISMMPTSDLAKDYEALTEEVLTRVGS